MPQQIITLTPDVNMTQSEVLGHIRNLLDDDTITFLSHARLDGNLSTTITESNGTFTITHQWDDSIVTEYKNFMSDQSEPIKSSLTNSGWTYTFNPETSDL